MRATVVTLRPLRDGAGDTEEWILGYGYDDSGISDKRHLTRSELDAVSTDRPVFVTHISVHFGYANSEALRRFGFDANTRIDGGDVVLDHNGQPSGLLAEHAAFVAFTMLPASSAQQIEENLVRAVAEYSRCGFTTFQDGGIGIGGDSDACLSAYLRLSREGRLKARAYLQCVPSVMDRLLPLGVWGFGNEFLTFGGVKYFVDGSIQGFTAALREDYASRPGYRGHLLADEETIAQTICKYHRHDLQVAVHTNGDAAIEAVLCGFERAVAEHPRTDLRHMMVHVQTASDEHLARMKAIGIIPTLFSRHIEVWGDRHCALYLGPERTARLNPAGSCVRLGMPFALHVDTPVLPVTALGNMHAAINRVSDGGVLFGPDQRISALDALRAYTTHASLTCGGEHDRGRIEPGRFADFVLLSEPLETAEPSTVRDIRVCSTICGDQVVYQA